MSFILEYLSCFDEPLKYSLNVIRTYVKRFKGVFAFRVTHLLFIFFVCFSSKHESHKVKSEYGTNCDKYYKVSTFRQIAKFGPDLVKINRIRCNEEIPTKSR